MKCIKCGMEVPSGNKFCPNCGNRVEEIVQNSSTSNLESMDYQVNEEINNYDNNGNTSNMSYGTNNLNNSTNNVNNGISNIVNTFNDMNNGNTNKVQSGKGKIFIIILIFILLIAGVLFLIFGLLNKDKHDYNTNVKNISYAMSNMVENSNNSGTVKLSMEMSSGSYLNMNMSAFIKYAKNNDGYDFQLGVDKTLYMDEINAYVSITSNDFTIYFPSSILGLDNGLLASYNSSDLFANNSSWYKFYLKFSDMGFDSLDIIMNDMKKFEKETIDYKELFPENNLKYIGKENNLDHYQLYFDENFYKYVYADLDIDEDFSTQLKNYSYFVDVYLNSKGNLEKISMDFSNFIDKEQFQFDKLLLNIEFKDLNNTVINIPQDVINSSKDINKFYKNKSSMFDYDSLLDSDFNLNF